MTLQQLKYFVMTANSSSIGKAAEKLNITQPTLSSALRDLEAEVGHRLLLRMSKGTCLTHDGEEFLRYARQLIEQADLLEKRWVSKQSKKPRLHIISQHYALATKAFIHMIQKHGIQDYQYHLREGRAFDVIEEVKFLRSDIGVLCRDRYSRAVIDKLLYESGLEFHPLFTTELYVLISAQHPLAGRAYLMPEDLNEYPRTCFEKSDYNALYFSEDMEACGDDPPEGAGRGIKTVSVKDKATMIHLLLGINAYTLIVGLQGIDLYGGEVIVLPFRTGETLPRYEAGWIARTAPPLEVQMIQYVEELQALAVQAKE